MTDRTVSLPLSWDVRAAESVAEGHRWVLDVMQSHGPALVKMLWRILGNEQDVCDAYQDAFVRLAYGQDRARPRNVKAFVFRAASNVAISLLRRRKAQARALEAIQPSPGRSEGIAELDVEALRASLRRHITRLPERLQSVVVLKDLAELSYGEIAGILGISAGAARVYRLRAVRLLSAWMAGQEGQ